MNKSRQKDALKNLIKAGKIKHISALEVFELLRVENPKMSIATVYRNLNLFVEKGLLLKIEGAGDEALYDDTIKPHAHLICVKCGEIEDLDLDISDSILKSLREKSFDFTNYDLSIKGHCRKCSSGAN